MGEWKNRERESGIEGQGRGEGENTGGRGYGREKDERVRDWKERREGGGTRDRREEEIEERRSKLFCTYAMKLKISISNLIFSQNLHLGIIWMQTCIHHHCRITEFIITAEFLHKDFQSLATS